MPLGILDNAIAALLARAVGEPGRVISFLEFEALRKDASSQAGQAVERMGYLVAGFDPISRPVLWRVLLASACIHRGIGLLSERDSSSTRLHPDDLIKVPDSFLDRFDWATPGDETGRRLVEAARAAVQQHLQTELQEPLGRAIKGWQRDQKQPPAQAI